MAATGLPADILSRPMDEIVRAAGLGVAYHAKPIVAEAAAARIEHGNLTALLWAQGYARREWVDG